MDPLSESTGTAVLSALLDPAHGCTEAAVTQLWSGWPPLWRGAERRARLVAHWSVSGSFASGSTITLRRPSQAILDEAALEAALRDSMPDGTT
jgi:hypothetical protein